MGRNRAERWGEKRGETVQRDRGGRWGEAEQRNGERNGEKT